ncbi:hypothetical protein C1645_820367 [Glomus cerebriforme]|uniref:Uncharacterized protein n=1 Tax=Glomus cerebriforme TaxID=658196 RepID=A0A397T3G0_9GLOM|nr:hypothetical protein C1645_820367 [Glomus cerebriforme]
MSITTDNISDLESRARAILVPHIPVHPNNFHLRQIYPNSAERRSMQSQNTIVYFPENPDEDWNHIFSETNTPASTFTYVTEKKNAPTQAEAVRKFKIHELINFLSKEEDLELDEDDLRLLKKKSKYGIDSNDIKKIPPFVPEPMKINDDDKELEQCITEIKRGMGIIGSATGSTDAVRCEYIFAILYASIYIARRITKKGITLDPQFEIDGNEATDRVDYAIKKVIDTVNEELIAITEGNKRMDILENDEELHRGVKKVMEVIADLLKDRRPILNNYYLVNRQHFTELEAKYAKIKAEKAELEARNAKLIKQMMEKNNRRDAENAEL